MPHDLEIIIAKDGTVQATVRGAKGKSCLKYAELLEKIVGRQESFQPTSEFYEPDTSVSLAHGIEQKLYE